MPGKVVVVIYEPIGTPGVAFIIFPGTHAIEEIVIHFATICAHAGPKHIVLVEIVHIIGLSAIYPGISFGFLEEVVSYY